MKKLIIPIAYLLLFTLLIQSCKVTTYHSEIVPLDQAYDKGKGKAIYKGAEFKFKNIYLDEGVYYLKIRERVKNSDGKYQTVESREIIDESLMQSIYLKDGKKSGWRTVGLILALGLGGLAVGIIALAVAYGLAG